MSREHTIITFPTFCAALGAVQSIRYGTRYAWITRADGTVKRLPLSQLPPREKWTAFNLAAAVQS